MTYEIEELLKKPINRARMAVLGISEVKMNGFDTYDIGRGLKRRFTFSLVYKTRPIKLYIPYEEFPGCCGIRVIHEIVMTPEYLNAANDISTGHGIGRFLFRMYLKGCEADARGCCGPGLLVGATAAHQTAGARLLRRTGWEPGEPFRNPNTHRICTTWTRRLTTAKYDADGPDDDD